MRGIRKRMERHLAGFAVAFAIVCAHTALMSLCEYLETL